MQQAQNGNTKHKTHDSASNKAATTDLTVISLVCFGHAICVGQELQLFSASKK